MNRKYIDARNYADVFAKALNPGILLTAKADGKVNTMTIGWGTVGINWSKQVFVAYIRKSRYTHELLEKNPEFTVNAPFGEFDKNVLGYCGSRSGRDTDKISDCSLTLAEGEKVSVPGIKEFPLTLECKVIYKEDQKEELLSEAILEKLYPVMEDGTRDLHTTYFGEIVNAYILEKDQ